MEKITVSIIGTAGRYYEDRKGLTKELFQAMIEKADSIIKERWGLDPQKIVLISGGAAWSDHVAVHMYLYKDYPKLRLHLPCIWDSKNLCYNEKQGKTANQYHHYFSKSIGVNTLEEIELAKKQGAELRVHNGFFSRNTYVAQTKYMIAFSWATDSTKITGGTKNTWNKCKGRRIHINLSNLENEK